MALWGTGRDGKSYDVSFGKGGAAVQAHKAAAEKAAKEAAAKKAKSSKK